MREKALEARIREVITSEERCDQERLALETRLRAMAVQTLGLAISGARSARANEVAFIHDRVLTSELERAEAEAEHSEEARRALGHASALAASAAETEVLELREHIKGVARKNREWHAALVKRQSHELDARIKAEVDKVRRPDGRRAVSCPSPQPSPTLTHEWTYC